MNQPLRIAAEWESLADGSPEELACFGSIRIGTADCCLSAQYDPFVRNVRTGPLLSGYHLAEWLAWNWWRLRWEPQRQTREWRSAHLLAGIGEGYVWPNVAVFSDGPRTALVARPSFSQLAREFHYVADCALVIQSTEFEAAVDEFVGQVLGRLDAEGLTDTDLHMTWGDVLAERADPEARRRRKLEALLGFDPDGADERLVERLVADAERLGRDAVDEVAAGFAMGGIAPSSSELEQEAADSGYEGRLGGSIAQDATLAPLGYGSVPAWQVGEQAARRIREHMGSLSDPLGDQRLAEMMGVDPAALVARDRASPLAFSLDGGGSSCRYVFRSRWSTGRRFEAARLVGDRLLLPRSGDSLRPAVSSDTYRQKAQRAFAAELLCPALAVDDMMQGDLSEERQQDVAEHFDVSPLTIRTVLAKQGLLQDAWERDVPERLRHG